MAPPANPIAPPVADTHRTNKTATPKNGVAEVYNTFSTAPALAGKSAVTGLSSQRGVWLLGRGPMSPHAHPDLLNEVRAVRANNLLLSFVPPFGSIDHTHHQEHYRHLNQYPDYRSQGGAGVESK
jgi:hypothetical protein